MATRRAHRRQIPRGGRTIVGRHRRTSVRRYDGYGLFGIPSVSTLLGLGLGLTGVIWYFRSRVVAVLPDTPDYQTAKVILASPDAPTAAKQIAAQVVATTSQKIIDAIAPVQTVPVRLTPMPMTTGTLTPITTQQPVILSRKEKLRAAGF